MVERMESQMKSMQRAYDFELREIEVVLEWIFISVYSKRFDSTVGAYLGLVLQDGEV